MRLRRLDLTRYGKFTNETIDFGEKVEGAPDLHIVYGPNEAGKSTAFTGFLDLLFGIEMQSRYGFLHPYPTMRVGGCLELSVGPRELTRIKRPNPTLRDATGAPVAESLILGDLGGLDRAAYRTMFSLDDETLEAGGKSILASNGELGQLLFSASAGLSDLSRTLLELRLEADGFAKPHARSGELHSLKAKLADLKQERDTIDTFASEYNRLAAARDNAELQYEAALAARTQAQAALTHAQKLRGALPLMAAFLRLRAQLAPFASLPDAPPEWLDELAGLQLNETRHRARSELAEAEVRRLSGELATITINDRALQLVGRLDRLAELRARFVTAEIDLPDRRRELAGIDAGIHSILSRLGRENEADPARLLLTSVQLSALNSLITSRSGIEAEVMSANSELAEALHELTEARHALQQTQGEVSPQRLAPLIAALAAQRESDHPIRLRAADRAKVQNEELLSARLAALAPWQGSAEALAAALVPDQATVEAWQATSQRNDAQLEQLHAQVETHESELRRRAAELDAINKTSGPLSDQEAAETRAAREATWAQHRRALNVETADAFEAVLRRDDIIGAARLGRERQIAKLEEAAQAFAVKQAEAGHARLALEAASARHRHHTGLIAQAIAALSTSLPIEMSAARLLDWMSRREKALAAWYLLRQAEREMRDALADADVLRERLTNALTHANVEFDPLAAMEFLFGTAQAVVDRAAGTRAIIQRVADCEQKIRKRELILQKSSLADKAWHAAWHAACTSCWLGAENPAPTSEAVRELLAASGTLGATLKARMELNSRIQFMQDDQAEFGREAARLAMGLNLDVDGHSMLGVANAVVEQAEAANRAAQSRRNLQAALEEAHENQRQIAREALIHARRAGEMMAFMGTESLIELSGKLRDVAQKTELERNALQAERDVLTALQVETLPAAQALLEGRTDSELEIEIADVSARLANLDTQTRDLFAAHRETAGRIAAVGGDDAAARIEERRRTAMLEIEDKALHYLQLRVGIAAADRALRAYRDQHRSAMMTRASEAFCVISQGAYRGLSVQPDKDSDILVALGADGSSKLAADLSKGTRFQLYLALRAAGYQEFAQLRPPVPFIADDIMETFDDLRAEETLRVFAGMAELGQVVYLTHHDHLRVIAERTVPGVRIHKLGA